MKIASALVLLATFAAPSFAHHSFAAEYDKNRPVKFTGVVTKMEWMNPHIYYYVDVKDAGGKITNFAVEGGTPNSLRRRGWGKDSLKAGDVVTVEGYWRRMAPRFLESVLADLGTLGVQRDQITRESYGTV